MNELFFESLIAKYLANEISETEEKTLMEWVKRDPANQIAFDEMLTIWGEAIPQTLDFSADKSNVWENIDNLTEEKTVIQEQPVVKQLPFYRFRNIAAAIALLVGIGLWWINRDILPATNLIVQQSTDDLKNIVLPDGSKIVLNAYSSLTYDANFKVRDVKLSGEAFFDIARDTLHPFSIHSNGTLTQVLGTSFSIRAYPDEDSVEVAVVTGKVAFSKEKSKKMQKVFLLPGNKAVLNKSVSKIIKMDVSPNELSWTTKELVFDDANMDNVVKTLKRYFHLNIHLENKAINNCHFTGRFKNADVDEVLKALSFALDLHSEKSNHKLILKGKGCD